MSSKKSFSVTHPQGTFWGCLFLLGAVAILLIIFTIASPPPHTAMYVCFTIFIILPFSSAALYTRMFRVNVSGTTISVRKGFGFIRFRLDVSEITRIDWRITQTKFGENELLTVYISKGETIPVESLMVNSGKMIEFLEENVDEHKIKKTYKSLVKK